MDKIRISHIIEVILIFLTIRFIINLNEYNQILYPIQEKYSNDSWFNLLQAIEIAKEPLYFEYLIKGFLFSILLVIYPYILFNYNRSIDIFFIAIINLILLIVLLIVFCNPILTTFAVIVLVTFIYGYANS